MLNDWNIKPDPVTLDYHLKQWETPYRSTVAFGKFIEPFVHDGDRIVDVGCGAGAATEYLAQHYQNAVWWGMDESESLIHEANSRCTHANFMRRDIGLLMKAPHMQGVVSLQTFSWMPNIETPLDEICEKIQPRWLAFSSLFYEGDISCKIEVNEPKRPRSSFYNIYSIQRTERFLKERGYRMADCVPFDIDINLAPPENRDLMGTYTVPLKPSGRKLQFSGPLCLPWHFLAFEKL